MENKLTLIERRQYGKVRTFADCQTSRLILEWLERKCFTEVDMIFIKKLGWEVEVIKE